MRLTNKIILGTVQFGLDYGISNYKGKPSKSQVNAMLSYAFDAGIRFLDSAEVYGNSHNIIGDFHKENPNKQFKIITKLPNIIDDNIENKIELYLSQLGVSKLHALLFHSFNSFIENQIFMDKLNHFKELGKINYIGVSIYTNEQFEVVIEDSRIDIIQLPFNLFDNFYQRGDLLKLAKSKNKIIHTRSAFLQGLFFMPLDRKNKLINDLFEPLTKLYKFADETKVTIQNMALDYCLKQKYIDSVLIGVDNLSQLKQNLNCSGSYLQDKEIKIIDNIKIENTDLLNPSLWKL